ncbi:unnamed protein product [Arctogadus glacialis]
MSEADEEIEMMREERETQRVDDESQRERRHPVSAKSLRGDGRSSTPNERSAESDGQREPVEPEGHGGWGWPPKLQG